MVMLPTGGMWKKLNARALASAVSNPRRKPQKIETPVTAARYTTSREMSGTTCFRG